MVPPQPFTPSATKNKRVEKQDNTKLMHEITATKNDGRKKGQRKVSVQNTRQQLFRQQKKWAFNYLRHAFVRMTQLYAYVWLAAWRSG